MDQAQRLAAEALRHIEDTVTRQGGGWPQTVALTQGRDETGVRATDRVAAALRAWGIAVAIVPVCGDVTDPQQRALAAATWK
jgi:hypothetical protein